MPGRKRASGKKTTEIVSAAGGELIPPPVADAVIEEVYEGIRGIQRESGLMGAVKSGQLMVEKFFSGNFTDWRTRQQNDASIRQLAKRFEKEKIRGFSAPNLSRFIA